MSAPALESAFVRILISGGASHIAVGTGFLVTPRHVLTCAHVVNVALRRGKSAPEQPDGLISLDFTLLSNQPLLQAKILRWFPVRENAVSDDLEDIAILELLPDSKLPAEAQQAPIFALSNTFLNAKVRLFGFPVGVDRGTYVDGILKGSVRKGYWEIHPVDNSRPVEPGFSGTAVWLVDEYNVCGMINSWLKRTIEKEKASSPVYTAYMIPADVLLEVIPGTPLLANPYKGLEAFREKDVQFYFGREDTVKDIQQAVERQPFTAVIGASGSGKSSAVFAGLVPLLRENWLIADCKPRKQPFDELAVCLVRLLSADPLLRSQKVNELRSMFHAGSALILSDIIRQIREENDHRRFLLIVDQFEELFTLNADISLRQRFITSLLELTRTEDCAVLITLRADFLETALNDGSLAKALNHHQELIRPINEELREIVERPAACQRVDFEPGLAELIVQDVGNEPGSLPLLEFCLTQLWERQVFSKITHEAYQAIGGVKKALAVHADNVIKDFDEQQVRQIFLKLVRPGQGTEDTRKVADFDEFPAEQRGLIKQLADQRLLVTSGDEKQQWVEVVHEALIRHWRKLRGWVNKEREFLVWREKLKAYLESWQKNSGDESALLRGLLLDEALEWQKSHENYLSEGERRFIGESEQLRKREQAEREAAQREKERQRKQKMRTLFAFLVAIVILLVFAIVQWQNAVQQQKVAEQKTIEAEKEKHKAEQQTIEANYNLARAFEEKAFNALKTAKEQGDIEAYKQAVLFTSAALEQKIGPKRAVFDQASRELTFQEDYHFYIFRIALAERWTRQRNQYGLDNLSCCIIGECPYFATFSPDGKMFTCASSDDIKIRLFDTETRNELKVLQGHEAPVQRVIFSPDGRKLVSASDDDTIRLWDIEIGIEIKRLEGHGQGVNSGSFSPDGRWIALASSADNTIRIWDVETGKALKVLQGHKQPHSVTFSPDGSRLVSASYDNTVRLWDSETGKELKVLPGHFATFSPDGRRLAINYRKTPSNKTSVRLLESKTYNEVMALNNSEGAGSVSFSPDGKLLAWGTSDDYYSKVLVRDAETGDELITFGKNDSEMISVVSFSPDGKWLIYADFNGLHLWDNWLLKHAISIRIEQQHAKVYHGPTTITRSGRQVPVEEDQLDLRGFYDNPFWQVTPSGPRELSPIYWTFIEGVKFLWQVKLDGLAFVPVDRRTPADIKKFGALLAPPPKGQSKFDQLLEWAEKQQ